MAEAKEDWAARSLSESATERRHIRAFKIPDERSQYGALFATGLPGYGAQHPDDPFAYAVERNISSPHINMQYVTITYTTAPVRQPEQNIENPESTPPEWNFDSFDLEHAARKTQDGEEIINKAGDAVEIVELESVLLITCTQILTSFDSGQIATFEHSTNTNSMWGYNARELWLRKIRASLLYRGDLNTVFFKRTIEIAARKRSDHPDDTEDTAPADRVAQPWDEVKLNAGMNHKTAAGNLEVNVDDKGFPFSTPQRLKEDGDLAEDGDDSIYLTFRVKSEQDFSALGLPSTLPS